LVSRSLVQQDKSNARLTTTIFVKTAFLAPSVIERTKQHAALTFLPITSCLKTSRQSPVLLPVPLDF
jgi:hypothetical protein